MSILANNQGFNRQVFFLVHIANYLCTNMCIFNYLYFYKYLRAYSRRLLGATIAPNLLP